MAGWFDFVNGQTLPASRVQDYLMDQSVMVFASAAARTTALPSPTDGMVSYLTDSDRLFVWRSMSSAWVQIIDNTNVPSGNAIVNGAFDFWQRSTSASVATFATQPQAADRWTIFTGGAGRTVSRQNSGLNGFRYAMRVARDSGNTATNTIFVYHQLETSESMPFANRTITVSFYARAGANFSAASNLVTPVIIWGTGIDQNSIVGYTGSTTIAATDVTLTTSWQRFERTFAIPATATEMTFRLGHNPLGTAGANDWYEVTGVQLEAGSVATPFQRAATTLQGELAACQRYYQVFAGNTITENVGAGMCYSTTNSLIHLQFMQTMRVAPTVTFSAASDFAVYNATATQITLSSILAVVSPTINSCRIIPVVASGLVAGNGTVMIGLSTSSKIYVSAEL